MSKRKMMTASLIALLALSACGVPSGDFCDVADPIKFNADTARSVVKGDRAAAETIDTHNRYGERFCGW